MPPEWTAGTRHLQPSLFVLGAAKSATTALHDYLGQHPDIFMSDPKEPFYFEAEYGLGSAFYFQRYFSNWRGERIVGESRHRNLYLPYVPDRIYSTTPKLNWSQYCEIQLREPFRTGGTGIQDGKRHFH